MDNNKLKLSNKRFIFQIWSLLAPYWCSKEKMAAWFLLVCVLICNYSIVEVAVKYSDWNREFFNLMQNKQWDNLWAMLAQFIVIMIIYSAIDIAEEYFRRTLRIRWRQWLTNIYLKKWLSNKRLYQHQLLYSESDNPDQRISQDIKEFCDQTLSLGLGLLRTITSLFSFTIILWNLSGTLKFELFDINWSIPGYMLWIAIIYSFLGTWLTHKITRKLVPLTFQQEKYEADFRFHLMRMKEYAEPIIFMKGEQAELLRSQKLFSKIWQNWQYLTGMKMKYQAFNSCYNELARIFPYLVAFPRLIQGGMQLGDMMQTATGFYRVQEAFSWFVDSYESVAGWKALTDRLIIFHTQLESIEEHRTSTYSNMPNWFNLTILLPNNQIIKQNMTGAFYHNCMIKGSSGSGKSTFFKTIAGLWPYYEGQFSMPDDKICMFIPQRSYLPQTSLNEILHYPDLPKGYETKQTQQILLDVGLEYLIDKLEVTDNWQQKLSGGEIQKLMLARCLVQKPKWLFLDESFSALDPESHYNLIQLLKKQLNDTVIIEISHCSELRLTQEQITL